MSNFILKDSIFIRTIEETSSYEEEITTELLYEEEETWSFDTYLLYTSSKEEDNTKNVMEDISMKPSYLNLPYNFAYPLKK